MSPRRRSSSARSTDAEHFRGAGRAHPRGVQPSTTSRDDGTIRSDAQHRLRPRDRLRPARRADPAAGGRPARRPGRRERPPHRHRLRGHPVRLRRADRDRAPRRRLPAAAPAGVPVVALPRDHGRHHGLGALGLDAARRHHQPRRDDQLQPLRPRRRRRLDAPGHRRHRPRRAGLPNASASPHGPAAASPGPRTSLETRHGRIAVAWRVSDGPSWRSTSPCPTGSPPTSTCRTGSGCGSPGVGTT